MPDWLILVDNAKDLSNADTPHKVMTTRDYLARPQLFAGERVKVINLARTYGYQSAGYYASLLGEARGHRIVPTVETMLELRGRTTYAHALPELEDNLNRCVAKGDPAPARLLLVFGECEDPRLERFGRLVFDWFRTPVLELSLTPGEFTRIARIRALPLSKLTGQEAAFFHQALARYTRRDWKAPKKKAQPRYAIAVLYDPGEEMPPSSPATLKYFQKFAEKQGIEIELITRKDLASLAEYDALFIRETTSIDNHTFRFARRAVQEGMPVIDDPVSMIRCTNKLYLKELLTANGVPVPPTEMIGSLKDIDAAEKALGYPMVLKIPDGSFSRSVKKVNDRAACEALVKAWLEDSDLLLAQKFMPTDYDWRIGVIAGQPIFACQYMMARAHWQIIRHRDDGAPVEGGFKAFALEDVPPAVLDAGVKAAQLIGDGFYGVDLKETADGGVVVIEVNDNPNLEHGIEDKVGRDAVWQAIASWFTTRIDAW
ncbi:MAG: RimK family protein [Hyphomicrobiaceae bacterium]|nr:RimK family protein [Hyphomicrobiaceae bacterium]